MWQRIQTLYLIVSTALIVSLFFCDFAVSYSADGQEVGYSYVGYIPYLGLLIIITFLNVLALLSFRIRVFQMRTAILTALMTFALQIWLGVNFFASEGLIFKLNAVFPIVCVILDVLAARNIFADQLIVETSSHLRTARRQRKK